MQNHDQSELKHLYANLEGAGLMIYVTVRH